MIFDLILLVVQGILNVLLAPLTIINITVDFIGSIPIVVDFLKIVAYVLPWSNILPLFLIIFSTFVFRIVIAVIKAVWRFIPIIGN